MTAKMKKMENITASYLTRAELWLCITTLIYFLMNGAQLFETLVLVPKWVDSAPDNFRLILSGPGTSLKTFWIIFHSLHEISFIIAIIFCWKIDPVKNWRVLLFDIHFTVIIWTLAYSAPNIMDVQKNAETSSPVKDLANRVSRGQTLNYVRVSI